MKKNNSLTSPFWWTPLLILAAFTPFSTTIDLSISHFFFSQEGSFQNNTFLDFIYRYGIIPGWIAIIVSVVILLGSWVNPSWKQWREGAYFMILSLVIGSGLITHVILKDHWGRPRPKQIAEFGGKQEFRPYYKPNFFHQQEPSKSFPCGHCSMGFYFFALAFLGKTQNSKYLYYSGMTLAWFLGILLSYARIAQGGHFFSDTVASGLIMWFTPFTLSQWINNGRLNT